ncbi:hypothetical protein JCM13267_06990 [Howardella ureilytica]
MSAKCPLAVCFQAFLGRADVSTTMNIYVDVTDALKKKELTAYDDYMTTKLET